MSNFNYSFTIFSWFDFLIYASKFLLYEIEISECSHKIVPFSAVVSKNEPTRPATSEIGRFLGQLATRQECKERQNRGRIEKRNDDIEKRGEG